MVRIKAAPYQSLSKNCSKVDIISTSCWCTILANLNKHLNINSKHIKHKAKTAI